MKVNVNVQLSPVWRKRRLRSLGIPHVPAPAPVASAKSDRPFVKRYPASVAALPAVLAAIHEKGLKVVTLEELLRE